MMWLIFNHVDAWGMTFILAALSLALRGALTVDTLPIPAALALGAWFAFALNDRYDAPFDRLEPAKSRRNAFTRNDVNNAAQPMKRFVPLDLVLLIAFVVLAGIFMSFGLRGILVGLSGWAAGWAYSAPPLRLKSRPGFDLFTHAAFVETFPYLAAVALAGAQLMPFDLLAWSVLALASLSAQLEQQARDYEIDSRLERNFTTLVGLPVNHKLLGAASILLLGIGFFGALTGIVPPLLWPGMAMTIPMIGHRLIRPPGTPRSELLIRLSMVAGAFYIASVMVTRL